MPSTICSVNAIQISSSCTSSCLRCSFSIAASRASSYEPGSSDEPVPLPDPPVPLGPSSGPGRKSVKSTSNSTAFSTPSRIDSLARAARSRDRFPQARDRGRQPGSRLCSGRRGPQFRSGHRPAIGGETRVSPACPSSPRRPRFELGTSPTRTERATRLRHTPSAERVPARCLPRAVARPAPGAVCSGR